MDWKSRFLWCCAAYLFLVQTTTDAQFIMANTQNGCGCQNVPINTPNPPVASLPINNLQLLTTGINTGQCGSNQNNLWISNSQQSVPVNNLALANNGITLTNNAGCQCNKNNLHTTNIPLANMPHTYSLAGLQGLIAQNNIQAAQNVQIQRANVPISNNVLGGALINNPPIANMPINACQNCLNPNNVQILGNIPNNYNNLASVQVNNILRQPCNNLANMPIQSVTNIPIQNLPNNCGINQQINTLANLQSNNNLNSRLIGNLDGTSIKNIAYIPASNLGNLPITNLQVLPNSNVLQTQRNHLQNLPMVDLANLRIKNVPNLVPNNVVLSTNGIPGLSTNGAIASNSLNLNNIPPVRYIRMQSNTNPISNCGHSLASDIVKKVVANVPVVPLSSLANLPGYNGMPVIKVSEKVYRLTPVN